MTTRNFFFYTQPGKNTLTVHCMHLCYDILNFDCNITSVLDLVISIWYGVIFWCSIQKYSMANFVKMLLGRFFTESPIKLGYKAQPQSH